MAADFAFIAMGQASLKLVAPLVVASKHIEKECVVLCYEHRPGKPADTLTAGQVTHLLGLGARCLMVNGPQEVEQRLIEEDPRHIVVQDAQWHYPFLVRGQFRDKTASLSMFTDTMHWALGYFDAALVPAWTYFPDEICRTKVEALSGQRWHGKAMGSPIFDHTMWIDRSASLGAGSVLFMAPHPALLTTGQLDEIKQLETHVGANNFSVLQRPKHEQELWRSSVVLGTDGIPYTALAALAAADIHINCFSISGFEARFLGRPMLNLDTWCQDGSLGNVKVKRYGLDSIYDSDNRRTVKEGMLIRSYEHLVSQQVPPQRIITESDSFSIDILRDVMTNA